VCVRACFRRAIKLEAVPLLTTREIRIDQLQEEAPGNFPKKKSRRFVIATPPRARPPSWMLVPRRAAPRIQTIRGPGRQIQMNFVEMSANDRRADEI